MTELPMSVREREEPNEVLQEMIEELNRADFELERAVTILRLSSPGAGSRKRPSCGAARIIAFSKVDQRSS
jgi:hypothetical protein